MAGFACPHCHQHIELFKSGGGEKTAKAQGLNFLGSIPFDTRVVTAGDEGKPLMFDAEESAFTKAFEGVVDQIVANL